MTIPNEVLVFARGIDTLMLEAARLSEMLTAQSEQASGAEAIGKATLAAELEQFSKVYRNYMPRIYKHVGEITPPTEETPSAILDLMRENEPHGEGRERLWSLFREAQSLIADNGQNLPPPTSEHFMLFARLYPHLGWLARSGAVEVI
jgi:hypothetical protein